MASQSDLRCGFLASHHILTKRLDTEALLPYLISTGLISPDEKELILHEVTGLQKTDRLLTILHRRGVVNQKIYDKVFELLSDGSVSAGQLLDDVLKKIKLDSRDEQVKARFDYSSGELKAGDNVSLRRLEERIVNGLSVSEVLPQLISFGVVDLSENERIR